MGLSGARHNVQSTLVAAAGGGGGPGGPGEAAVAGGVGGQGRDNGCSGGSGGTGSGGAGGLSAGIVYALSAPPSIDGTPQPGATGVAGVARAVMQAP